MTNIIAALAPADGITKPACAALGLSRASVQRRRAIQKMPPRLPRPRQKPPRSLTVSQQQTVLDLLHEPRFADQVPAEIFATLLDENTYHCSIRTMYRILDRNAEVRERRAQLRHPAYQKPELLAERPNKVWSWDITKLMGPTKWSYFYLYVILDIFSRRVVGWCVADAESASLFKPLFDEAISNHNVPAGQLTLHADRGSPMKAKATAFLLADLGVTKSHSRPHTSNDNPFSEGHFKIRKYRVQHGLQSVNLLLVAYRNSQIINRLLGRPFYPNMPDQPLLNSLQQDGEHQAQPTRCPSHAHSDATIARQRDGMTA